MGTGRWRACWGRSWTLSDQAGALVGDCFLALHPFPPFSSVILSLHKRSYMPVDDHGRVNSHPGGASSWGRRGSGARPGRPASTTRRRLDQLLDDLCPSHDSGRQKCQTYVRWGQVGILVNVLGFHIGSAGKKVIHISAPRDTDPSQSRRSTHCGWRYWKAFACRDPSKGKVLIQSIPHLRHCQLTAAPVAIRHSNLPGR